MTTPAREPMLPQIFLYSIFEVFEVEFLRDLVILNHKVHQCGQVNPMRRDCAVS